MKATVYRWVRAPNGSLERLYDVGILADGSLHNPRGYPGDVVREAVEAANESWRQRRSTAAKKAAETRRRRRQARVYKVVEKLVADDSLVPNPNCRICGRGLDDPESIRRGIGPECWQDVLAAIEHAEDAQRRLPAQ